MFCQQCGNKLSDDAIFCENCGTKVIENDNEQNIETQDNNTNTAEPQVIVEDIPPEPVIEPVPVQENNNLCTNCGAKIEEGTKFCGSCGQAVKTIEKPVQEKYVFCKNCGAKILEGVKFCGNCGASTVFGSKPQTNTQTNYVPPQANYAAPVMTMPNIPAQKSSMDAKGLVLGIICVVSSPLTDGDLAIFFFIPWFTSGIAGVILSAIAISRNKKAGHPASMAIVGLVLSIIGIAIGLSIGLSK